MEFKKLQIDSLIPASYNPRKKLKPGDSEFEKIKDSITKFGFVDPIIVNKDLTVIGGHQRITVLKTLGYTEVECIVIDIDKTQEKALNINLNKVTGSWDEVLLADLLKDLESSNFDLKFTGFEPPEIDQLFNKLHNKEIKEDDFDVDKALKEPTLSKQGDLWLLGRHRLLCGDSTKPETYELLMDGKKANLIVTDPPYGISYEGGQGTIKNDNLNDEEFYKFLLSAFQNMNTFMDDEASIYIFHADTKGIFFRRAFEDAEFHLSGVCQWVKQSLVLGRSPYQWRNEPVIYGWKKKGKHKWYAGRSETTVWEFDRPSKNPLHSTMKPIALISYPIKNSSAVNGIVLEPFSGSGSTLISCQQTDRICYAIEIEERFVDVGVKRFIDHVGSDEDVFLLRDGVKTKYADVKKE